MIDRWKHSGRRTGLFYLLIGTLLPAVVMLAGFLLIRVWPFGDGTVLIIDSLHQYLPFYTDFHEKLVHGESLLYSFSGGFGYDFWSTFAYYMASPFNFLIALVPTPNVGDFMDLMILLKVSLCGGIFSWYLHKRNPSLPFMPIVFGSMYALGNFLIGYYFNLMWLDSIAVLPLIMLGIERIVKGRSGRMYGLALFYGLWCNYYIGFMLCLFSCLYLLICLIEREGLSVRGALRRCLIFAWYSLLAGGMASAVLLPAYLSLNASESMTQNSFPGAVKFYTDFVDLMYAHFMAEHPINISDSQVGLNAYCGVSALIFGLGYLLDPQIRLREKVGKALLALFLLLSFSVNIFNYMWHGFHTQNGLPNRFAFLYVVILLVMCFDAFPHFRRMPVWMVLLSGGLPLAFSLWAVITKQVDWETYGAWNYLTPAFLAVYLALLLIVTLTHASRSAACALLGGLMLIEAVGHGIYGIEYNENVTRSIYLEDQASYREMVEKKRGTEGEYGFFRTEFDSQRMRNVAMFAGAHSMVLFNSTMSADVTNFCDRLGIEARTNKNGYNGVTKLMNDVFGIRYVLSSKGKGDKIYGFTKIDDDGNLSLYENENALSIGFLCNPEIRYWEIESGTPIDVQNDFVNLATGREDLYLLDRTIDLYDNEENGVKVPEGKQVYLYLPDRIQELKLDTPEYRDSYKTYNDHLYIVNALGEENIATVTSFLKETQNVEQMTVYTCPQDAYQAVRDDLARSQLYDVRAEGNTLSGVIDADRDGIMLLTVPYDEDWAIIVDQEKTQALKIGGAMIGIELSEGRHEISMVYVPAGLKAGSALSAVCAALLVLTLLLEEKQRRKKKAMEITFSKKAQSFQTGIFTVLNEKKEALLSQGKTIYNLSVGTPDFPTSERVMQVVSEAAKNPENYKYSLRDLPELIRAMQDYYQDRFQVTLSSDEVMSVYGSQEGITHIAWALSDPGDVVLVPNPGYPIFKLGPQLCGALAYEYPLREENGYLPVFDEIPEEICRRARFMIVNYPGNPLCKAAPDSFYEELIRFARTWNIVIVHDNAYADIIYGGREGKSFLSFPGAKEVGVEFYSLSKTFDYTGARVSFLVGNAAVIEKFKVIRSQIDYGIFLPVQYGAIAALKEPKEAVLTQCARYEERMHALCQGLREIGWEVPDSEGTMFVWAPLPEGYTNSEAFVLELMERTGVICTPGSSFGSLGEGYVRFALVLEPEQLAAAVNAIRESGILGAE